MTEKSKQKRVPRNNKYRGCLGCLFQIITVPIICYLTLFLFGRFGGEWAAAIPLPPDSELLDKQITNRPFQFSSTSYDYAAYLYMRPGTPEETAA